MPRGAGRPGGGAGASVEIDGLNDFLRDLKKFEPELSKEVRTRLRKAVDRIAEDARSRTPKKSGALQKGIRASVTNTGARLLSKAKHARIHEFGGRHPVFGNRENFVFQPARPHIFPAVAAGREAIDKEALAALDDAIKEIGFRG